MFVFFRLDFFRCFRARDMPLMQWPSSDQEGSTELHALRDSAHYTFRYDREPNVQYGIRKKQKHNIVSQAFGVRSACRKTSLFWKPSIW